jgi:hypothetical protein
MLKYTAYRHLDFFRTCYKKMLCEIRGVIQSNRKVNQPIPDKCYICQKINYIEIRKQKTVLY